jgi:RNA ligase (TIGR02306 family)
MSAFEVKVTRIRAIEPIENADVIELAVVGDYRSVVKKGEFKAGNLAVYIPEASVVPQSLLVEMGLEGKLAGKDKNRVKAIKLRGCLSQGLLYPVYVEEWSGDHYINVGDGQCFVREGDNVAADLGITKYEPPIPAYMSGEVYNAGQHLTVAYDIENFKKYPDVLVGGEEVVMTEKLHGTFCGFVVLPNRDRDEKHVNGKFLVFSKGLGANGLCFKDNEKNRGNVYFRALENSKVFDKLANLAPTWFGDGGEEPLIILGEVYGRGVQDLEYGATDVAFRVFDIAHGYRGSQQYWNYHTMKVFCAGAGLDMVPLIYKGPFSKEVMLEHTSGVDTLSGKHIREGVVIKPIKERTNTELGRVILKSVSEEYLLRKGGTEYN